MFSCFRMRLEARFSIHASWCSRVVPKLLYQELMTKVATLDIMALE